MLGGSGSEGKRSVEMRVRTLNVRSMPGKELPGRKESGIPQRIVMYVLKEDIQRAGMIML